MLAVPRKEPRMILNHFPNLGQSAVCFSFSPVLATINLQSHAELQSLTTFLRSMKVRPARAAMSAPCCSGLPGPCTTPLPGKQPRCCCEDRNRMSEICGLLRSLFKKNACLLSVGSISPAASHRLRQRRNASLPCSYFHPAGSYDVSA